MLTIKTCSIFSPWFTVFLSFNYLPKLSVLGTLFIVDNAYVSVITFIRAIFVAAIFLFGLGQNGSCLPRFRVWEVIKLSRIEGVARIYMFGVYRSFPPPVPVLALLLA